MSRNYCTTCGSKLKTKLVGAEKYARISRYAFSTSYAAYNEKTGERNYITQYYCDNKSFFDFRRHSNFGIRQEAKPIKTNGKFGTAISKKKKN